MFRIYTRGARLQQLGGTLHGNEDGDGGREEDNASLQRPQHPPLHLRRRGELGKKGG